MFRRWRGFEAPGRNFQAAGALKWPGDWPPNPGWPRVVALDAFGEMTKDDQT